MKFSSQLIQKQFARVGKIFPKPTLQGVSSLEASPKNPELKKQLV
ncbi:MAG: hypothetical protein ABJQ39_10320 [Winogradskyella arenosi]